MAKLRVVPFHCDVERHTAVIYFIRPSSFAPAVVDHEETILTVAEFDESDPNEPASLMLLPAIGGLCNQDLCQA